MHGRLILRLVSNPEREQTVGLKPCRTTPSSSLQIESCRRRPCGLQGQPNSEAIQLNGNHSSSRTGGFPVAHSPRAPGEMLAIVAIQPTRRSNGPPDPPYGQRLLKSIDDAVRRVTAWRKGGVKAVPSYTANFAIL